MSITSPTDLPNVIAAYKGESGRFDATVAGSSVTAARGKVKRWEDYSGNAVHLTQATDDNCLVYDPTDNSLVAEQGVSSFFTAPTPTINRRAFTLFLVCRLATIRHVYASAAVQQFQFITRTTGDTLNFHFDGGDAKLSIYNGAFLQSAAIPPTSWATIALVCAVSGVTIYVNGVAAGTIAAQTVGTDTLTSLLGYNDYALQGKFKDLVLYSDAKDATAIADLHAYGVTRGAITTSDVCLVDDGDSMTYGYGTTLDRGWVQQCLTSAGRLDHNLGEASIQLTTLVSQAAARVDPLIVAGKTNVLRVFAGRNDLVTADRTAVQVIADRRTYVAERKAAGWDAVVYLGVLPEPVVDTSEAYRLAVRTQDLLDFPRATGVPHIFTDGTGGWYIDYEDLTITRADGVHPDDAGSLRIAVRVDQAMEAIAANGPAGLGAGMTLTAARAWVRQFARSGAASSQYSDTDIDHAIMVVGEQFARITKCARAAETVALAAHSAVADVSGLTLFRPERIMDANILTKECPVEIVDWQHLYQRQIECTSEGTPELLAFETWTTANVWPTPNVALSLRLRWWQPFTSWTAGTAEDASITFNLPDDFMTQILTYGVTATLQHNEPSHKFASESWQKYLAFEQKMMGAGNLGAKVVIRSSVRDIERRRWR